LWISCFVIFRRENKRIADLEREEQLIAKPAWLKSLL